MKAEELEAIRADISAAIPEAQWVDHSLLPDLLNHLLNALSEAADGTELGVPVEVWADGLLRECQIRAVSQIPFYGRDLEGDEPPHSEEHR